ncbi:toll-like receptor Tollo [Scylla paramamosain]|uniref:Toll-like receptor 4 n=1 Tax=Scylla paramamosain TaxID=85552 RepID=A0AAE7UWE3_SCYPA|nr:toll-like receptor 4 [Scylla paramamosain]
MAGVPGLPPLPLPLLLLMLLALAGSGSGRPPDCEWRLENTSVTARTEQQVSTSCRVRTLTRDLLTATGDADGDGGGDKGSALSALAQAAHVTALSLHCARQVVFESHVEAGMFGVFPRLQELHILGCKVTQLPPHALARLPNLRRLTLRAHHEDWPTAALAVHPDALSGLGRLETLDLAHNALWALPAALLCRLPALAALNLTHNRLHHLPDLGLGAAACGSPLRQLDLAHNQVSEVPAAALAGAAELQTLSLRHNRVAHLADTAFQGLAALRRLDLSHNRLVAVPRSALADLTQLRELRLSNNSLGALPPDAFAGLTQLLTLDLAHNQLTFGPAAARPFTGLIRLRVLDLSHNRLAALAPDSFRGLYSLQVLRLGHNRMAVLPDGLFAGLNNLHTLALGHNRLRQVSRRSLQGLVVVTHLLLHHNLLGSVHPAALDNCSSLHHLSLAHNLLDHVPQAVSRAPLLRTLDLDHNLLTALEEGVLRGLTHLQELRAAHNQIAVLNRTSLIEVPALRLLDLSHNGLAAVEFGALEATPRLAGLSLHHNLLGDLNGLVGELQNLTWLNASHNAITWFDYALLPRNLEWLDLSHNQLAQLDNFYQLEQAVGLRVLYAAHNNISDISASSVPDSVEELHLHHNAISYVASNTFLEKASVALIDLRHNSLTILEEAALRLSPRQAPPPLLLLSHNPLQCDCAADWLLRAAGAVLGAAMGGGSVLPHLGDVGRVECQLPGLWGSALVPLVTVQPQQFLCTYRRHCFTLCHCCDFDACDCEQTCPRNCTCYHDHTWTHNVVDCSGGWTAMPSGVPMDVTEAFMDGNAMGALTSHALIGRKNLRVLHLNHSEVTAIQNRTFNGLKALQVLRLDHNLLAELRGHEFLDLHDLRELYLQHNRLRHLSNATFVPLRAIEVLRLDHNLLTTFPVWTLRHNLFLLEAGLHHNPWSCECAFLADLRLWLEANRIKATNASLVRCRHNSTGAAGPPVLSDTPLRCDHYVATTRINSLIVHDYLMMLLITAVLLLLLLAAALTVFAYRRRLRLWAVGRYGKRLFEKSSAYVEEREKLFDAFVTHSAKDATWVCGLMAPELEASGYRVCVAQRDCGGAGAAIAESIACSRRVVVVLSRGLVDAEWCRYDFKSAHVEALRGVRRRHVVVVLLEDVPRTELDAELAALTRAAATVLRPRDPRFWDRLKRSLPSLRGRHATAKGPAARPLVPHHTTSSWPRQEGKGVGMAAAKSLTVNPYWETAVGEGVWPCKVAGPGAPLPWVQAPPNPPSTLRPEAGGEGASPARCGTEPEGQEHTYMSVSECGEAPPAASPRPGDAAEPPTSLAESWAEAGARGPAFLRHDAPDYLTRSWVFHAPPGEQPPPLPGQTYFV